MNSNYPDDYFYDDCIADVYLTAEVSGQPVNERHLASIRNTRRMLAHMLESENALMQQRLKAA